MPDEVATAPSVNCLKGRFGRYWKTLCNPTGQMNTCLQPRLRVAGGSIDQSVDHSL